MIVCLCGRSDRSFWRAVRSSGPKWPRTEVTVDQLIVNNDTIRYDTIGEFNVDWKAEYSALSSTRSQKKKLKQPTPGYFSVNVEWHIFLCRLYTHAHLNLSDIRRQKDRCDAAVIIMTDYVEYLIISSQYALYRCSFDVLTSHVTVCVCRPLAHFTQDSHLVFLEDTGTTAVPLEDFETHVQYEHITRLQPRLRRWNLKCTNASNAV